MNQPIMPAPSELSRALAPTAHGFDLRPMPLPLRGVDALVRRLGDATPRLDPERLVQAASRKAGLPPRFATHVEDALEVLCRSVRDEARLHWFGRRNTYDLIVTGLTAWLGVDAMFRADPSLDEQPLESPLIVTGLPRSGTTHLHRLLSALDGAEPIPLHRHFFPLPRALPTGRLEAELKFLPWRLAATPYGLDAQHLVRPGMPDECNFGMRLGMRSMIFWATAPTYGYLTWLLEQDLREAYRDYRRVLLLHQARAPGKRITLKCPHHLAWLPALHEALPEARVVQTHRDPLVTVVSECKLILSLQAVSARELDWRRTVAHNNLKAETFASRSLEFADTDAGRRVCHVDYRQLVSDPVALVRGVHEHFELPFGEREVATIERFVADNRQHKHGKNHYGAEQYGIDVDALRRSFAPYRERFLPE